MSRGSQGSRSVFVGNIPYTATEEALQDIFRTVGHVVSFRCAGAPHLTGCEIARQACLSAPMLRAGAN